MRRRLTKNGIITYEISGKVDVTDTGWVQVAKAGLADLSKVAFVGINDDAEICITGGLAILADQSYDIDVSFESLKLSKPNPTYGGDYTAPITSPAGSATPARRKTP